MNNSESGRGAEEGISHYRKPDDEDSMNTESEEASM
jgi:hypothetical protein